MNDFATNCPISARPAYFGTRRIAPVAAISHVKAEGARPVVEILRPAQRHFTAQDIAALRTMRPGAPMAPFLAQLYVQEHPHDNVTADATDRYECAAALTAEPHAVCIATV